MKVEGLAVRRPALRLLRALRGRLLACSPRSRSAPSALAFTAGLAFLVGYYLLFTGPPDRRPARGPTDAEIAEGAGELGFFSPHSWWPLAVARLRGDRLPRDRLRLVAVPHRRGLRRPRGDRLGLRVLPGRARPLTGSCMINCNRSTLPVIMQF